MSENFFLVKIVGDVEPVVRGPYFEETMLVTARHHRLSDPNCNTSLFRMQVTADGQVTMGAFALTEVGGDDVFVIQSSSEDGFWSNEAGWVSNVTSATYFASAEMKEVALPLSAGSDATWVPLFSVPYSPEASPGFEFGDDAEYDTEVPQPGIEVSLDGGESWSTAREGVRIVYRDILVSSDAGEEEGELHINATYEGLIMGVWVSRDDEPENIGTLSDSVDELAGRLVESGRRAALASMVGQRCLLLDPRCKGQVATAERVAAEGMKMTNVGIVPHGEYRLATPEECAVWDNR